MLIDTHCHLDAREFDQDRGDVLARAWQNGVGAIVIPAVERSSFAAVAALCQQERRCYPAYGIHPMYVTEAGEEDLAILKKQLQQGGGIALGEIGLDYFAEPRDEKKQKYFFTEQLKLACEFDLPVILHVRRAIDPVLKELRRFKVQGGIAHAFNGSFQQAEIFINLGFALGFGGGMTYEKARHIRQLARGLPLDSLVLETDAPDISPEWCWKQRNEPGELARIARQLAELRNSSIEEVVQATGNTARRVLPALRTLNGAAS